MSRFLLLATLSTLLSGCAQVTWVRPGANPSDFARDRAQCNYEADLATPNTYNGSGGMGAALASGLADGLRKGTLIIECMESRGWLRQTAQAPSVSPSPQPPLPESASEWDTGNRFGRIAGYCNTGHKSDEWIQGCLAAIHKIVAGEGPSLTSAPVSSPLQLRPTAP